MPEFNDFIRKDKRDERAKVWSDKMPDMVDAYKKGEYDPDMMDPMGEDDYAESLQAYVDDPDYFKGKRFIDVGVGVGSNPHKALTALGAEIVNLDIAPDSIKHMNRISGESGVVADAFNLPFADSSIDGIICSNLINASVMGQSPAENLENYKEFIREIYRVLKPSALFIQSNFGTKTSQVGAWLNETHSAGFSDVEVMTPDNNIGRAAFVMEMNKARGLGIDPLAFIAKK